MESSGVWRLPNSMKGLTERLWRLWILWTLLHLTTNTCTCTTAPPMFYSWSCTPAVHHASSNLCLICRPVIFTDDLHNIRGCPHLLCDLDTSSHVVFTLNLVGQTSYIPELTGELTSQPYDLADSRYQLLCTSSSLKTSSLPEVKVKCYPFSSRSPSVGRIHFPDNIHKHSMHILGLHNYACNLRGISQYKRESHYKSDFSRIYKHFLDTLSRTETNSIPNKWKIIKDSLELLDTLYVSNHKEMKDFRKSVSAARNVGNRYKLLGFNNVHRQKHLRSRVASIKLHKLESTMYKQAIDAHMEGVHNNVGRDNDRYTKQEQSDKDRKYYTIHHKLFSEIVSTQKPEKLHKVPVQDNNNWKYAIIGPSYDNIATNFQRSHREKNWQSLLMRGDLRKKKTNNALHDNNVIHENDNYEKEVQRFFNVQNRLRDTGSNNYYYQSNEKGLNRHKEVNMDDDKLLAQRTFTNGGSTHNDDIRNEYNSNSNNAGVNAHVMPNTSSNKGLNNSNRRRLILQTILSMFHKWENNRKQIMTDRPDDRPKYRPEYQADYDSLLPLIGKRMESTDNKWSSSELMAEPVRNSPPALSANEPFHSDVTSLDDNLHQMEAELRHLEQNLPPIVSFQSQRGSSEISDDELAESSKISSAHNISHEIEAMLHHNEENFPPKVDKPDRQSPSQSNLGYTVVKGKEVNDNDQHQKPDLEPEGQSQGQHETERGIRFGDKADLVDPSLIPAWVIAMAVLCIVLIVVSLIMFFYDDK